MIAAQNHLADPALIQVGQELLIPYVTYRHQFATADSDTARKEITQLYYNTADRNVQLIWEVVNGVAQREIHKGAWLHIPDLANGGHHTVVANESLQSLAYRWYGDEHLAEIVEIVNNLTPGSTVTPGQVLIQPGLNRLRHIAGDTLTSLCEDEYGPGIFPPGWRSSRPRITSAIRIRSSATRRYTSPHRGWVGAVEVIARRPR